MGSKRKKINMTQFEIYNTIKSAMSDNAEVVEFCDKQLAAIERKRAKDALTTKALAKEESFEGVEPSEELLNLSGLGREMAYALAARGVGTLEDLAEQGIDDLADIEELTAEKAGELIMAARNICWFGEEQSE